MSTARLLNKRPIDKFKSPLEELIFSEATSCRLALSLEENLNDPIVKQKLLANMDQAELEIIQKNVSILTNNCFTPHDITPENFLAKFKLIKRREFKQKIISFAKLTALYHRNAPAILSDPYLISKMNDVLAHIFQRPTKILELLVNHKKTNYTIFNQQDEIKLLELKTLNELLEIMKQLCLTIDNHIHSIDIIFSKLTSDIDDVLGSSYTDNPASLLAEANAKKPNNKTEELNGDPLEITELEEEIEEAVTSGIENKDSIAELSAIVNTCYEKIRTLTSKPEPSSSLPSSREGTFHIPQANLTEKDPNKKILATFNNAIDRLIEMKNQSDNINNTRPLEDDHRQVQFEKMIEKYKIVLAIVEDEKVKTGGISTTNKIILNHLSLLTMEIKSHPEDFTKSTFKNKMNEIQAKLYGREPMSPSLYSAVYAILTLLPAFCIAYWGNKLFRPQDQNARHWLTGLLSTSIFTSTSALIGYIHGRRVHTEFNNNAVQTLNNKIKSARNARHTIIVLPEQSTIEQTPLLSFPKSSRNR